MRQLLLAVLMAAGALAQTTAEAEKQLQAAIHTEMVQGDLKGAVEQYNRIVARHARQPEVAARALYQIGQCQEKLGQADARRAYERLIKEYPDQKITAEARQRLAALGKNDAAASAGMRVRQVWTNARSDVAPSPDGRFMAYTDNDTGSLAVRELATGTSRRLAVGSWETQWSHSPVFSPDGKQVAYGWFVRGQDGPPDQLRIVAVNGKNGEAQPRVLLPKGGWYMPYAWSPDGKSLLVSHYDRDAKDHLLLVSVSDGRSLTLKSADRSAFPGKAAFSPDGRFLLYHAPSRADRRQRDIYLLSIDGAAETPLVQHPAQDTNPVWAPDGKRVLFVSDRSGSEGLWALAVAGGRPQGAPQLVKADMGRITPLGITAAGSYYYTYAASTRMMDVYIADLDPETGKVTGQPKRATERYEGSNLAPAWSPDGQFLAWLRPGRPSAAITILSAGTGEERELFPDTVIDVFQPAWYPDGSALLVTSWGEGNTRLLHRIDIPAGRSSVVRKFENTRNPLFPSFSPDGKKLFFLYGEWGAPEHIFTIRMSDIESGRDTEIYRTKGGIRSMAVSKDGSQVAFFQINDRTKPVPTLMILPASGGQAREVAQVTGGGMGGLAWSPDGRYVFFNQQWNEGGELWRAPVAGGAAEKAAAMEGLHLRQPSVHPSGRKIAFTTGTTGPSNTDIWVMENFLSALK